jgi:phosphatidylserine/phosphatidylglycerophosphate/cardiolipin synthase-like enzyme
MHDKFLVRDSAEVWTGSTNMTTRGLDTNDNASVVIRSPELAESFSAEFHEMFVDTLFGPRSPSGSPHSAVQLSNAHVSVWFGPEDDLESKVLRYLRAARHDIAFLSFSFTSDSIGKTLVRKSGEGVDVRGVIESRSVRIRSSEYDRMNEAGIDVQIDGNPYAMHHKLIIIDGRWTLIGSNNLSRNAAESNDENMLVIKSRAVANVFRKEFDRVREIARLREEHRRE